MNGTCTDSVSAESTLQVQLAEALSEKSKFEEERTFFEKECADLNLQVQRLAADVQTSWLENMELKIELDDAKAFGDYARLRMHQFEKMLTSIESYINMLVDQRDQRDFEIKQLRTQLLQGIL